MPTVKRKSDLARRLARAQLREAVRILERNGLPWKARVRYVTLAVSALLAAYRPTEERAA